MIGLPIEHYDGMFLAINLAKLSKDPSVQNGACIIDKDFWLIGQGWNSLTRGVEDTPNKWERPAKYMWVEHAERNAIYDAINVDSPLIGATMYACWASCADCARAIVQSGISRLVRFPTPDADRWNESIAIGDEILRAGGVEIVELDINDFDIPEGLRLGQFREVVK